MVKKIDQLLELVKSESPDYEAISELFEQAKINNTNISGYRTINYLFRWIACIDLSKGAIDTSIERFIFENRDKLYLTSDEKDKLIEDWKTEAESDPELDAIWGDSGSGGYIDNVTPRWFNYLPKFAESEQMAVQKDEELVEHEIANPVHEINQKSDEIADDGILYSQNKGVAEYIAEEHKENLNPNKSILTTLKNFILSPIYALSNTINYYYNAVASVFSTRASEENSQNNTEVAPNKPSYVVSSKSPANTKDILGPNTARVLNANSTQLSRQ